MRPHSPPRRTGRLPGRDIRHASSGKWCGHRRNVCRNQKPDEREPLKPSQWARSATRRCPGWRLRRPTFRHMRASIHLYGVRERVSAHPAVADTFGRPAIRPRNRLLADSHSRDANLLHPSGRARLSAGAGWRGHRPAARAPPAYSCSPSGGLACLPSWPAAVACNGRRSGPPAPARNKSPRTALR